MQAVDDGMIDPILLVLLIIVLVIATITDIRYQKIPNRLTYPAVLVALIIHTVMNGTDGLVFSAEGLGLGIAIWLLLYLAGKMGAGDTKLMGAVGAFVGPMNVLIASVFTAVIGGIYALVLLAMHGYLKETAKRFWGMLKGTVLTRKLDYEPPPDRANAPKLCYGIAIAVGTLLCLARGFL